MDQDRVKMDLVKLIFPLLLCLGVCQGLNTNDEVYNNNNFLNRKLELPPGIGNMYRFQASPIKFKRLSFGTRKDNQYPTSASPPTLTGLYFGTTKDYEYPASAPPPSEETNATLTDSCNCKQILISSLGEAQHIQSASMGTYKKYSNYQGKPSYYGGSNSHRLYFLQGSGWLVGPTLGSPTGFIHNGNQYSCPYLIPNGWMYVNNGYWYKDDSLVVRCIS